MTDTSDLLAQLTAAVARAAGGSLGARLCDAYRDLAGVAGAAITVRYGAPDRVTLAVTDGPAARLEDLQDVVGEGPGHRAWRTGRIETCVLPPRAPSLWALFDEAALDVVDSARIHGVPMRPAHGVLGVVTLYEVPHAGRQLRLDHGGLQFLANALGAALLRDTDALDEESDEGPWASRAPIHQATGMVVARLHISPEDALALLRAHAYAHQATLAETAASVVDRRLTFPVT